MPWTIDKPPPPAKNWDNIAKQRCVAAANATLARGGSDEEAIYACIAAAGKSNTTHFAEPIDIGALLRLKPREAIQFLRDKKYKITWDWWEEWGESMDEAFTVAKLNSAKALKEMMWLTRQAIDEGWSAETYKLEAAKRMQGYGLSKATAAGLGVTGTALTEIPPWRYELIYRTNLQTSYNVGRYLQQVENIDDRPYWQYVAVMDSRTRPSHAALHGLVLPADDPAWNVVYPPNGFNCRCRVRSLSERRLKQKGLKVSSSAGKLSQESADAGINRRTGERVTLPVTRFRSTNPTTGKRFDITPDAGWSDNPGRRRLEKLRELEAQEKAEIEATAGEN